MKHAPFAHAVPDEIVEVLDATMLLLPQVTQLNMLPVHWQAELVALAERAQCVLALHVYRKQHDGEAAQGHEDA